MKVHLLETDDWQGLYIDGKLITEGHKVGEGDPLYLLKTAEMYGFTHKDVTWAWLTEEDDDMVYENGCMPQDILEFNKRY
jgi:hypothetical protein